MKKLLISAFLLLNFSSERLSQWQIYQTQTTVYYTEVSAASSSIIWASGNQGTVVKTTNGGQSFNIVNQGLPGIPYYHISALNENYAWVIGGINGDRVFRTTNGGLNWTEQFYSQPEWINKIHFFNINTGIFLRDPLNPPFNDTAGFFITRNGGVNWYRSANPPGTSILNDGCMGAFDTNLVWFTDNDKIYLLKAGLDNLWQVVQFGIVPLDNASFINSQTGYVINRSSGHRLFRSTNGGLNWSLYSANTNVNGFNLLFLPNTNLAFTNSSSNIGLSTNSGLNWQYSVLYTPSDSFVVSNMDAYDSNSVWLGASKGRLLKYNFNYIGINPISTEVPTGFKVYQNYPNPFNPSTKIKFDLPESGDVNFKVYDVLGKIVYELNEHKHAGSYEVLFEGANLASGIYYYRVETGTTFEVRKMILLK
jgi:photosystem II stability/assembly factor-like uncharacterized protein